jgi:serine protease AprX
MNATAKGLSWDGEGGRRSFALVTAVAMLSLLVMVAPARADTGPVDVIVRSSDVASAERLVERLGGVVGRQLSLIGGFSASVPASALATLAADGSVLSVVEDGTVKLQASKFGESVEASASDGSMFHVNKTIDSEAMWGGSYTGSGVTVALIDSGVVPVAGLDSSQMINGLDISFESQSDTFRYLDTYGHGTHMAGIIAGRDQFFVNKADEKYFTGVAPNANLLSIKVASFDGAVDVSQVIAAIDWVVAHRNDNGMNVRVLNLSFGTGSNQSYVLDPLSYAVEQAWKKGLVVVVAAGNDGNGVGVRTPATNPYVIAVGAANTNGTIDRSDDKVASFSNCSSTRPVDVLAPGVSIVSLRNPGSYADVNYPSAVVANRFFKGSGTSQAAAVVSGAAAVILDKFPNATPNQVKAVLKQTAQSVPTGTSACQGSGLIDLGAIRTLNTLPTGTQKGKAATGLGTLDGSRGGDYLTNNGVTLTGEKDIFGKPFNTAIWAPLAATGSSWSGGNWNGSSWSGSSWSGSSWSGSSWSGSSWSGSSWSGSSWSGSSWSNMTWTGSSWSGSSWSGSSWSGSSWSGSSWSGQRWE